MKRAKLTAQQQKKRDVLLDVLTVLFACPLISAAIAVFNVPNDIAPGGVAGLSTALAEVFPPISVGVWMVMLNTPLLLAAWRRFKRRALVMTLAATGSVAVLVDIFGLLLPAYSNNPLLAAIAGGTFTGLGAGLLLQRGISTGRNRSSGTAAAKDLSESAHGNADALHRHLGRHLCGHRL